MKNIYPNEHSPAHLGSSVNAVLSGPTEASQRVLLIHGNPGSHAHFEDLAPLLSDEYQLLLVDLPGFGKSSRSLSTPKQLPLESQAEAMLEVANAFGWNDFFIVGHSHGGGVAQMLASKQPHRVRGIVLLSSLGFPAHPSYKLLALPGTRLLFSALATFFRRPTWGRSKRWLLKQVLSKCYSPEVPTRSDITQELNAFEANPNIFQSMVGSASGAPCSSLQVAASQVRCPALLVHGDSDLVVPQQCARNVADTIKASGGHSQLVVLEGAGHMLLKFQANDCAHLIRTFFKTASPV